MLHAAGIPRSETVFFSTAIKTGCFLQIWLLCDSSCNSFAFASLNPTRSPHPHSVPTVTGKVPLEWISWCQRVYFCITFRDLPQLCSCHRNLCLAPLQYYPCISWVNLIAFGNFDRYFRVSSSFAKNWVWFWMVFKRRKGECWILQLCTYQNSLLI